MTSIYWRKKWKNSKKPTILGLNDNHKYMECKSKLKNIYQMKVNGIRQKLRPIGISIFLNLKKHRTIQSQILTIISNEIISNLKLIIKFLISVNHFTRKNFLSLKVTFKPIWKLSLSLLYPKKNRIKILSHRLSSFKIS